ncbi:MAG: class I tRNA ligase family protein [Planctomycetes bacterium]|nr:class I tRNA ligase family protein [Planctomycetota bacterium]
MFQKVAESEFLRGEHAALAFWQRHGVFQKLREKNAGGPRWSFLDGPITANNPMGVHHAWGRTYKDAFQRYFAMTGHELRYQNGFDCQGLWVEVEVEKEFGFSTKDAIREFGVDRFVNECKKRVLRFAARQTEQSIRLGYWMDWDDPDALRRLAETIGTDEPVQIATPSGREVTDRAHAIVARLGNPEWGGSYFTFSTENNETIWTFLKKCFQRGKIYRGYDVMPWSGRAGSAYSQMEIADGRRLTTHRSCFVRFPLASRERRVESQEPEEGATGGLSTRAERGNATEDTGGQAASATQSEPQPSEYLLVWTTTPWTLTSNVACAVNPDLDYVKLRTKRDGAVYYFAKDNLDYQRLGREFKEGFGRPEWSWPEGVPKLKTISQIFKEQGGYEILGELKGADLIGREYTGPFDDLEAQQLPGGFPPQAEGSPSDRAPASAAVESHRVIDGGRDARGNPNVVAGEGTGIVHIAPGCGDVDHQLGEEHGLPGIAPLEEDGRFAEGFGDFTGRVAVAAETAELVFEKLREKHMLVYVEDYPHVYPHCWRTGDELVFRLVDEWFINMDWRDEIKDVTRAIRWLPESIDGQAREIEWLSGMRDWMISKKRFWGLALPIWIDPDDPTDFEVIGSLAELKERAVEGWDDFQGQTPHRPWIDRVKIKSQRSGRLMSRIPDVGNPWLDAGIVPFSTMHYNTDRDEWRKWFPADFVTECFPGQFRNWFYSLLSLATMMRHDETDDPAEKRPFKTLLGHRLVKNEHGEEMHKASGTAIWFEEAAEQLGVDTIRWMYLAQNPALDLRFGTRHPEERVTLETVDGPLTETTEGLPICRVTSKPADEIRRQILIPLWNSYAFFVNYAVADEFDPSAEPVPVAERPEIDRWILSNLQALIAECRRNFENFDSPSVCAAAARFIDDLSNWYIRRNRRRFWRSREEVKGQGSRDKGQKLADPQPSTLNPQLEMDRDKLAAYQTLHAVLVALTKLLAPCIPFLAERMYRNLVQGREMVAADSNPQPSTLNPQLPASVHLCDYPAADESLLDPALNQRMAIAQQVVRLGHMLRDQSNHRVRQPLAELLVAVSNESQAAAVDALTGVILEELNVKRLDRRDSLGDLVRYSVKPNLKTLGPKYGKLLGVIRQKLPELDAASLAPLRSGQPVTVQLDGNDLTLLSEDVLFETEHAPGWVTAEEGGFAVALSTELTPELVREGAARDFVRQVQQLRKEAGLDIQDRIRIAYATDDAELQEAITEWSTYIRGETLADSLEPHQTPAEAKDLRIGHATCRISLERA